MVNNKGNIVVPKKNNEKIKVSPINTQKNNVSPQKKANNVSSSNNEPEFVRIKKVGVLSVAATFSIIGIVIGLLSSIISIPFYSFLSPLLIDLGLPGIFSNFWIVFLLIPLFGISCFVLGVIFSLFYNLTALITKGVKLFS
jgi:cell division protein FtsX